MFGTDGTETRRTLRSRIGRRLVGLFVICSVGPLVTIGVLGMRQVRVELMREAHERLHETAKIASIALLENLKRAEDEAQRIAARRPQERLAKEAIDSRLLESVEPVHLADEPGVLVTPSGRELRLQESTLLQLESGDTALIVQRTPAGVRVEMLVPAPVARPDRLDGVVATLANDEVWAEEFAGALGYDVLVFDVDGTQLWSTIEAEHPLHTAILEAYAEDPSAGRFVATQGGETVVGSYRLLFMQRQFGASWIVAQVQTEKAVFQALHESELMFGSLALLSAAVATWIALRQLRRMLRPLMQLTAATKRVAAQDFGARAEVRSADEFETLGDAFDAMVASIDLHMKERDRHERLLREARDRAIEAVRKETEFLQNVTHELRTPMTSIRASAEILAQFGDEDPEARREFLDIICKETDHLARLIEDVLDLGTMESGGFSLRDETVDVERTIRDAIVAVQPVASVRDTQIQLRAERLPIVRGDADRLRQIWTNLLSNAIKFGPEGGTIRVRLGTEGDDVVVEVKDHGCGIAAGDIDAIFERFRQVGHDLDTDKPTGTGLGLPIVREIVARLSGTVTVKSRLGQGSSFFVRLPRAGEVADQTTEAPAGAR